MFHNMTQIIKNKLTFNDSKRRKIDLCGGKNITCIIKKNNVKHHDGFYCLNCLHSLRTEKKY